MATSRNSLSETTFKEIIVRNEISSNLKRTPRWSIDGARNDNNQPNKAPIGNREKNSLRRRRNHQCFHKEDGRRKSRKTQNDTIYETNYQGHFATYAMTAPLRHLLRLDLSASIMMTFIVATVVVSSANLVFAAQRESHKGKDSSLSNGNLNQAVQNNVVQETAANGIGLENAKNDMVTRIKTNNSELTTMKAELPGERSNLSAGLSTAAPPIEAKKTNSGGAANASFSNSFKGSHMQSGNAVGINRNTIEVIEDVRNGPYFDKSASKNVTALLGKTAYLNCRVKNLGNKTMLLQVSWVRHRDIHLLTVGRYTYTSDQRFRAIHQPQTEDWILQIKYPQHRDSGIYECQVSTTPHMSHYIHLNVVEPSTEIIGAPDLYIESGSTINLTCVIYNSPEPPAYIFWNHNNAIINYDSPRGGVSVVTNKGETTTSFLLIKSARPSDSGLYQCNPSNAKHKSVTVHVLNGEFPAAMQRAGQAHHRMSQIHYILVYLSMYCFTLLYAKFYIPHFSTTAIGSMAWQGRWRKCSV